MADVTDCQSSVLNYMRKYRNYTREDVEKYAKEVYSMADLLKKLDLADAGGNYANMKRKLFEWKIDCSHWTGHAWNKSKQTKDWSNYTRSKGMKTILIRERGHKCENCQLEKWQGQLIPLELDHVSGDRTNNTKENLRLLCCNCHALTPTWRGKKLKAENETINKNLPKCTMCENFVKTYDRKCCSMACARKHVKQHGVNPLPNNETLIKLIQEHGYRKTARLLGISNNRIIKAIDPKAFEK
jgi:hypothetical protein